MHGEAPPPDLCDVSQRLLVLDQHLGELQALLRTDAHHVPEQEDPVRGVPHLHTQMDTVKMALFCVQYYSFLF